MIIVKSVRELRKELGFTQQNLSDEAQIDRTLISRYESGYIPSFWTYKKLRKLANKYGIELKMDEVK